MCVAIDQVRDDAENVVQQDDADDLADDEDREVNVWPAVLDLMGQSVQG